MKGQQKKVDEKIASNLSTNHFLVIQMPRIGVAGITRLIAYKHVYTGYITQPYSIRGFCRKLCKPCLVPINQYKHQICGIQGFYFYFLKYHSYKTSPSSCL